MMPYPSLPQIGAFIAGVGLPGVLALGMLALLYQGLGILRGISSTLERMDATLKTTVCPFTTDPTLIKEITNVNHSSLASRLSPQGAVQPAGG